MPDPARLPSLPTFQPSSRDAASGLDVLATAALSQSGAPGVQPTPRIQPLQSGLEPLHSPGPYNAAAALPQKVVKRILSLEFVEMSELRADVWPEDPSPSETPNAPRRSGRPPVINIKTWLECYARMAAVLVTRFPEKAPELWAYQSTILNAAHSFEGSTWVAYDRQYRREMLARKDLNWSTPNSRLYNEAFTGRARMIPRCQHCLSEDHTSAGCPHHPNPMVVGWLQPPGTLQVSPQPSANLTTPAPASRTTAKPLAQEVCRNYNNGRCRFTRCRFAHTCSDCAGSHAAVHCPQKLAAQPQPAAARGRSVARARSASAQPYPPLATQATGAL